ncbi:hypothetical protein [Sphingobacterium]|uniref:Uncharacterized protein n=2 Tax=Sphingobacterium TaxID=28453 RepID=A0A0B8T1M3_9SPHI|nr:hypothetical protein [Sphingobacterium]KGE14586.1 hypothetical protein DI53_1615 [Sphingobacterium deserti]TDS14763.1 hypothetical protein B0I21_103262 [Sphingobacterium paludis]
MKNIKQKIVNRLPNILTTKTGLLKLNQEQKEALAERLELFFRLEFGNASEEINSEASGDLPTISLN